MTQTVRHALTLKRIPAGGVALMALVACSAPDGVRGATPNLGKDPTSTVELTGLGGAAELNWTLEEIASRSDAMVRIQVVDVLRSRLNTVDGGFPSASELAGADVSSLEVYTEVRVRRSGAAAGRSPASNDGEEFTIVVGGGQFITDLDAEQAAALGILKTVDENGDDFVPTPGQPGDGIEAPVDGPVRGYTFGNSPAVALAEGDEVTIFLTATSIPGFGSAGEAKVLVPTHSRAVLSALDSGRESKLAALVDT